MAVEPYTNCALCGLRESTVQSHEKKSDEKEQIQMSKPWHIREAAKDRSFLGGTKSESASLSKQNSTATNLELVAIFRKRT